MSRSDTTHHEAGTTAGAAEPVVTEIRSVIVFVDDLEQALDFYVRTLGLVKRRDEEPEPGFRTVEVSLPGAVTTIMLVRPSLEAMGADEASRARDRIGEPTGIVFEVAHLEAAREELERRGVEFVGAPGWQPSKGHALRFRDPADNELALVEAAE